MVLGVYASVLIVHSSELLSLLELFASLHGLHALRWLSLFVVVLLFSLLSVYPPVLDRCGRRDALFMTFRSPVMSTAT